MTPSQKVIVPSVLLHALSGAAIALILEQGSGFTPLMAGLSALGAGIGGWPVAPLYGQKGAHGWFLALLGAVVATAIGALLGGAAFGALAMENAVAGMIWGPVVVGMNIAMTPAVTLAWAAPLVALHLIRRRQIAAQSLK